MSDLGSDLGSDIVMEEPVASVPDPGDAPPATSDVIFGDAVPSVPADPGQVQDIFAGWETQERLILSMLAAGTPEEKKSLKQHYMMIHGGDISKALDSEASFHTFVVLCLLEASERDALLAHRAILKGDNDVLIELVCTRSPQQLCSVKDAYQALYKKSVEEDIAQARTEICHELLLPLTGAYRYSGLEVDEPEAQKDAAMLHEKISEKDCSNRDVIWFLATRSKARLKAALDHYRCAYGHDVYEDLEADPSNHFLHLLRNTVECLTCPEKYLGKVLHVAMNPQTRDGRAIARVLCTRADVDMKLILEEYCRKNGPYLLPQFQKLVALVHDF